MARPVSARRERFNPVRFGLPSSKAAALAKAPDQPRAVPFPAQDHQAQPQGQKSHGRKAQTMEQIARVEQTTDGRSRRLADIEQGGVERHRSWRKRWISRDKPDLLRRIGGGEPRPSRPSAGSRGRKPPTPSIPPAPARSRAPTSCRPQTSTMRVAMTLSEKNVGDGAGALFRRRDQRRGARRLRRVKRGDRQHEEADGEQAHIAGHKGGGEIGASHHRKRRRRQPPPLDAAGQPGRQRRADAPHRRARK